MFSHLLGLDKVFFQKTTTGEVMALATNDLSSVQLASGMGIVAFVDAIFMGLAAFGFMFYIDLRLTFIALAADAHTRFFDKDAVIPPAWKVQKSPGTVFPSDRICPLNAIIDSPGKSL